MASAIVIHNQNEDTLSNNIIWFYGTVTKPDVVVDGKPRPLGTGYRFRYNKDGEMIVLFNE